MEWEVASGKSNPETPRTSRAPRPRRALQIDAGGVALDPCTIGRMRRLWTVAQRVLILVVVVYLGRLVAEAWLLYRIEHGSPNAKYSAAELLSSIASSRSIRALVDMQRGPEPEDFRSAPRHDIRDFIARNAMIESLSPTSEPREGHSFERRRRDGRRAVATQNATPLSLTPTRRRTAVRHLMDYEWSKHETSSDPSRVPFTTAGPVPSALFSVTSSESEATDLIINE